MNNNSEQLQRDYDQLQSKFDQLKSDHEKLQSKFDQLQSDYSENTIIQSMNEMKLRYEKLTQTTVPNFKYKLLSEKYISLVKRSCASCVFIDHILQALEEIDIIRQNDKNEMTKIKFQLVNIREILEDDLTRCINPN
jgi:sugar-specific transcriptional regulator TrmB